MKTAISTPSICTDQTALFATLNLDDVDALQWARVLPRGPQQPPPQLVIDCSNLVCQRTLGVSHVVSQLLVLRKAGATIWLRNVNAPLRRCLKLLQLSKLFNVAGAG